MTTERCEHCGRTLHQKPGSVWDELHKQFNSLNCIRCDDGAGDYHNGKRHGNIEISHANAVRMAWYWRAKARHRAGLWGLFWKRLREMTRIAWKYRAITRRRCDKCRHYDYNMCDVKRAPTDEWYVPADGQCPKWEIK